MATCHGQDSMHYVYILLLSNRQLYTGCTKYLLRRHSEHRAGRVQYTKGKVLKLIHYEAYSLTSDAVRREKFLKTTEGKRLLRKQIKDLLKQEKLI